MPDRRMPSYDRVVARSPKLRFLAYRRFDMAHQDANNSMVALLIGSRLTAHTLEAHRGSKVLLPDMYPPVVGIDSLNRTVDDSRRILDQAEKHLAYMAIPFVQSVFEDLVDHSISLLQKDGAGKVPGDRKSLQVRLEFIEKTTTVGYEPADLELIDFLRLLRNQIIHTGATLDTKLRNRWTSLSINAKAEWETLAGRAFDLTGSDGHISAGSGELVASLALYSRVARQLGAQLAASVSSAVWATAAIEDFAVTHPRGLAARPTLEREVQGFVRFNYSGAKVLQPDVAAALAAATS